MNFKGKENKGVFMESSCQNLLMLQDNIVTGLQLAIHYWWLHFTYGWFDSLPGRRI